MNTSHVPVRPLSIAIEIDRTLEIDRSLSDLCLLVRVRHTRIHTRIHTHVWVYAGIGNYEAEA